MHVQVCVRDLLVEAFVGVHRHEKGRRQTLRLTVILDILAAKADQLEATFDYERIVAAAASLADEHVELIETFARRLAERCRADPRVKRARVEIEKPAALANAIAGAVIVIGN